MSTRRNMCLSANTWKTNWFAILEKRICRSFRSLSLSYNLTTVRLLPIKRSYLKNDLNLVASTLGVNPSNKLDPENR